MTAEPEVDRSAAFPDGGLIGRWPPGRHGVPGLRHIALNRSPLARKIVAINLAAILILVAGNTLIDPSRATLLAQHRLRLVSEAELVAAVVETRLRRDEDVNLGAVAEGADMLAGLEMPGPSDVFLFDPDGRLIAITRGQDRLDGSSASEFGGDRQGTIASGALGRLLGLAGGLFGNAAGPETRAETQLLAKRLVARSLGGATQVETDLVRDGRTILAVATPIETDGRVRGAVALTSGAGEIDALVRGHHAQLMQMVAIAILVSVGLSLVLASTIANPLADLAAAAESGRERGARTMRTNRIRIPDLTARRDEIGSLSAALRGMVAALYDRIDANEQFAADVAHEIKNPLASLQSAIGSLRVVAGLQQRERLLDVLDQDVRRLDRLVSEISNASRLDSELVKEEERRFDLVAMLAGLGDLLARDADRRGIEFTVDLPREPILVDGLEDRLAQVFVNLVSNAISFCEQGDAIRIWARTRAGRVLVVVEDTGPGIPESALAKVFVRFYSERPAEQFGNNSGLGLAISKQIVEAHGGVIWAENIAPTGADPMSEACGARFVVGLPL